MRAEHVNDLEAELAALPARIGMPILAAWNAKEDLLGLLALAHHPMSQEARYTPHGRHRNRYAVGSPAPSIRRSISPA